MKALAGLGLIVACGWAATTIVPDADTGPDTPSTLATAAAESAGAATAQDRGRPHPTPGLSPDAVVRIQLQALRDNDTTAGDSGIALVFEFASPSNRAATGPLEHFVALVKGPVFRPMLGHLGARQGPMLIIADQARQIVTVTSVDGEEVEYLFTLTRQRSGPYKDCWLTDGVVRHADLPPEPPPSDLRRV